MTIEIKLQSTPFANDPDGAEKFYEALGRVIVLWGRFETTLGLTLQGILNLPEAAIHGISASAVPPEMNQKAKLWRRSFKVIPQLENVRSYALSLISDALDAHQDRSAIVHSVWESFISTDPLAMSAQRHRYIRGKLQVWKHTASMPMLETLLMTIDGLIVRLIPITLHISLLHKVDVRGQ